MAVRTKSGFGITFSVKVCAFAGGAPLLVADMVTVDVEIADDAGMFSVNSIVTGDADVGLTVLDGMKAQVAPEGNPEQAKLTVPLKEPSAVA